MSMDIDPERLCLQGHPMPEEARYCPTCGMAVDDLTVRSSEGPPLTTDTDVVPMVEPDSLSEPEGAPAPRPKRHRRWWVAGFVCVALLLGATGAAWYFAFRTTDEDRYLSDLSKAHLLADFGTADAAVAKGEAFCSKLKAGAPTSGYKSQQIAVARFCPQFSTGFSVVPTPQEKQLSLTTTLRDRGLGGRFASDAAAVAYAENICRSLDDAGAQQGPEEAAVAVSIYCIKYEAGFKTLHPIKVDGTFTLNDSDPSIYYPSITGSASSCEGAGGYSDISDGTEVVVKDSTGAVLTTTQLGRGTGSPPVDCEFKFSFTVMDGSAGAYSVTVSRRGELHYTAAELKIPNLVALTLGE